MSKIIFLHEFFLKKFVVGNVKQSKKPLSCGTWVVFFPLSFNSGRQNSKTCGFLYSLYSILSSWSQSPHYTLGWEGIASHQALPDKSPHFEVHSVFSEIPLTILALNLQETPQEAGLNHADLERMGHLTVFEL